MRVNSFILIAFFPAQFLIKAPTWTVGKHNLHFNAGSINNPVWIYWRLQSISLHRSAREDVTQKSSLPAAQSLTVTLTNWRRSIFSAKYLEAHFALTCSWIRPNGRPTDSPNRMTDLNSVMVKPTKDDKKLTGLWCQMFSLKIPEYFKFLLNSHR